MNLILTTDCNKHCSFCFARDALKPFTLPLETIKKYLEYKNLTHVKLLGGEPTLYPQFSELLNLLKEKNIHARLISNLLFSDETAHLLKDKIDGCLINVSEINEVMFSKITKNLSISQIPNITLGFTLDLNNTSYFDWLDRFHGLFKFDIRVSLPFPTHEQKKDFIFYKNYDYVNLMKKFIHWGNIHEHKVGLDCPIYPCMIENEETEQYLIKWIDTLKFNCNYSTARDLINDDIIQYCYPGKEVKINAARHKDINTIDNELIFRKKIYTYDKIPAVCRACCHFGKKCFGPCLGFLHGDLNVTHKL